ncbi:CbiX/SirB N-terminal domain-containing protein [Agrococcus sp. SCSIO52902]|uniref:sirohydrochlorin chelatase n=1 Tax=Agrococcus sp. SCSIO52902 TaxID=2933290 RepID=UPI001FF31DF8|nr:CbiX/SirB N-terminal domain-containing protein [Agrococcus sp. SCSIO52902]UOW01771.1 sirohydrochlorin chelatase [Agrococcus sp. SCSIO52902]
MSGGGVTARPVLVGCSHGTADPAGRATIRALLELTADRLPGVDVVEAFVDVQQPALPDVVAALAPRPAVIVPLLLSTGFHVEIDVRRATRQRRGVVAAPPLGPDDRITAVLADRWLALGADPRDPVVLAVAGSSRASTVPAVEAVRERFAALTGTGPVLGYGSAVEPTVPGAVALARADGAAPVSIASYLLAPGHFQSRVLAAGAERVSRPLGVDGRIVEVVVERYLAAAADLREAA